MTNINYLKKSFQITSLIILSTSIYACAKPEDRVILQEKNKESQTPLAITENIKPPTWNNVNIKTIPAHTDTIWSVAFNPQKNLYQITKCLLQMKTL